MWPTDMYDFNISIIELFLTWHISRLDSSQYIRETEKRFLYNLLNILSILAVEIVSDVGGDIGERYITASIIRAFAIWMFYHSTDLLF